MPRPSHEQHLVRSCRPMLRDIYYLNGAARLLIRYGRDTAATGVLAAVENIRAQLRSRSAPAWLERELRREFDEAVEELVDRKVRGEDGPLAVDGERTSVDLAAALEEADRRVAKSDRYIVMDDQGLPPMKPGPLAWRGANVLLMERAPELVDELRAALRESRARAAAASEGDVAHETQGS